MQTRTLPDQQLERQARQRAGAKLGWYMHAFVYVAVNLLLLILSFASGRHWAVFPLLGWGLALAIHGVVVFVLTGGAGLYQRLLQQERERLARQRDSW